MLCSSFSQGRPRKRGRGVGPIHCEPRSFTEKETSGSVEPNGTGSRRVAMDTQQNSTLCVIHGLITSFFERVLSCSRTYKRFVIFIFFFMHVWSMIRICWFSLWHDKDYMFLWVTRSIARFSRWLIHKTRQVQHNYVPLWNLSWRRKQAKSWARNLVSFWIQFKGHTQVFHLRRRKQDGHVTCLKHINLGRTWWCRWKVDNATFHAGFCLGVGEHEGLITTAKFRRNTIIPCMLLQSFDCRSRSNRPCAAKVKNHVCRMVSKIQRVYRHPCSVSFCAKPPSIWSPGIVSPMAGRPIVWFPGMAVSFFVGCFWGWKSGLRISSFLAFSFLVLSFTFVVVIILACAFVWLVRAKTTLLIAIIAFWQAFLAFVSCGPPSKVLFWPNFGILCLFFAKECSSASLGYTFVLSFSLSFSSFQLAALISLDCQTHSVSSHVQKHDLSSST